MGKDNRLENIKVVAILSVLTLGTATGAFFLARHFIKKAKKTKTDDKALDEGDPATYARQLKMAFENDNYFGWGTNTTLVFDVFNQIPSKSMYAKVQKAYANITEGKNLNADLADELSTEEYSKVIGIINSKGDGKANKK